VTIAPEGTRTTSSAQDDCQDPDPPPPAERIVVALLPKVMGEVKLLQDRTTLSRTDIANRAITLYEFIDRQLRTGHEILIRERRTGEMQTVLIL